MPLPKPKPNETEEEFIARCMSDSVMENEYPDTEQRSAVCYSQWRGKTSSERSKMERKSFSFKVAGVDQDEGIIEGYAATFNGKPDAYGDVIEPGAFKKTLKERGAKIVSLFNHDINQPIGKPECTEDENGLFVKIKLVRGLQRAEEVLLLTKADVVNTMSIGYETIKEKIIEGNRHLKELRLYDVSPVVFAANPEAVITGVKSLEDRLDELEGELKEGRVLSRGNIAKIRAAIDALSELLELAEPSQDTPQKSEPYSTLDRLNSVQARLQKGNLQRANERLDEILSQVKGAKTNG